MREPLEQLLFQRYPPFYVGRHLPLSGNLMARGFPHGDGWFAIIDVLSNLASQCAGLAGKRLIATQVKQKFGGLRFYMKELDDLMHSARAMGECYSYRVSELSGRPGVLHVCDGHYRTVAPGECTGYDPAEGVTTTLLGVGTTGALDRLRDRYGARLPGGIDVPDGWVDLVQELILQNLMVATAGDEGSEMGRLTSITTSADGQLAAAWTGEPTPDQQGREAFARAMARYIDPVSGAIGPVDDNGIPQWKRAA